MESFRNDDSSGMKVNEGEEEKDMVFRTIKSVRSEQAEIDHDHHVGLFPIHLKFPQLYNKRKTSPNNVDAFDMSSSGRSRLRPRGSDHNVRQAPHSRVLLLPQIEDLLDLSGQEKTRVLQPVRQEPKSLSYKTKRLCATDDHYYHNAMT